MAITLRTKNHTVATTGTQMLADLKADSSDIESAFNGPLTWTTPTFVNSWVGVGAPNEPSYSQDDIGTVFIKGLVTGGSDTTDTVVFTLPVGMRPTSKSIFIAVTSGGAGPCSIDSSGNFTFLGSSAHTGNANTLLSIAIVFKGEQ